MLSMQGGEKMVLTVRGVMTDVESLGCCVCVCVHACTCVCVCVCMHVHVCVCV